MGVPTIPTALNEKKGPKIISEKRKIRKPLMEKRRRDRINVCLSTLATLFVGSSGSCLTSESYNCNSLPSKVNRLEKADILEHTVKHWHNIMGKNIKNDQPDVDDESESYIEEEGIVEKSYALGYNTCISAVNSILQEMQNEGENVNFKSDLQRYLNEQFLLTCPNATSCHDLPKLSNDSGVPLEESLNESSNHSLSNESLDKPLTFIPTKLHDGNYALVLKNPHDKQLTDYDTCPQNLNASSDEAEEVDDGNYSDDEVWRPW